MPLTAKQREYWNRNLRLMGVLLAVWFVVTFGVIWFARPLNHIVVAASPSPST